MNMEPYFMKFISSDKITQVKCIGSGGFAYVFKVKLKTDDNNAEKEYAQKIINRISFDKKHYVYAFNLILREECFLNLLNHQFIINLVACNFFVQNPEDFFAKMRTLSEEFDEHFVKLGNFVPSFLTALAEKKNLHDLIRNSTFNNFSPLEKNKIIYGICRGVWYLHCNKIYHRDLKSQNILIMNNNLPKISDFGTSKFKDESIEESVRITSGLYTAPEVYERIGSFPSDVFSLAIVLWEIFEGVVINSRYSKKKINYKSGARPSFSNEKKTPEKWQNLIVEMWQNDTSKRPTMNEIIAHIEKKEYFLGGVNEVEMNDFISDVKNKEREAYFYKLGKNAQYVRDINSNSSTENNNNGDDKNVEKQNENLIWSAVDFLINNFLNEIDDEKQDDDEQNDDDDEQNDDDDEQDDDEKQQVEYENYYRSYLKFIYGLFSLVDHGDSEAMFSSAMFCMEYICDYSIAYKIIQKLENVNQKKAKLLHFLIEKQSEKSLFYKAMLLEAQGKYQEAVDTYYECIEQGKIDEKVLGHLGRLLAVFGEKEEKEEGIKLMENAASLNDQFSLYHLGVIYLNMAEKEEEKEEKEKYISKAAEYFERADQFPDSYLQLYLYYCINNPKISYDKRIKYCDIPEIFADVSFS